MVCRVLQILFGAAALTLAGCQMHGPYGYDGGSYGYQPGNSAMIGPSGSSPYVTQPGPVAGGMSQPTPYYPSTNSPFPSTTTHPIPNTGSTIPPGSPFSSKPPPSTPLNNSTTQNPSGTRPVERLPPDSDEYPEAPPAKTSEASTSPPSISTDDEQDPANIKADQKGKSTQNSAGEEWLNDLEKEEAGKSPVDSTQKDSSIRKSAFTDDSEDEFAAPSEFNPGEVTAAGDEVEDPAIFLQTKGWYRGIARFDDEEQAWYLQYKPAADIDTGEGILYFAEKAELSNLKNGTRLLVNGDFDPKTADRFDRPKYVVRNLKVLLPDGSQK